MRKDAAIAHDEKRIPESTIPIIEDNTKDENYRSEKTLYNNLESLTDRTQVF